MFNRKTNRRAFSLIELVIVVVIIGIIAAIAIPRMSRGAAGAGDSALSSNLATLRKAIDLYAAEHDGAYPTVTDFVDQMTKYSDASGATSASKDATHTFGPYLRAIPIMNSGSKKTLGDVKGTAGEDGGWYYDETKGEIRADAPASEEDSAGKKYVDY